MPPARRSSMGGVVSAVGDSQAPPVCAEPSVESVGDSVEAFVTIEEAMEALD